MKIYAIMSLSKCYKQVFFSKLVKGGNNMNHLPKNPNLEIKFQADTLKEIYLAGGCFWGVEAFIARVKGVAETSVGYANGVVEAPNYKEVCTGKTGYAEAVHVRYEPSIISLSDLLKQFFDIVDPTSVNKQGEDVGHQYRSGIYYTDEAEVPTIEAAMQAEQVKYERPIVTEIVPLKNYYLAEEYHQKYLEKNPEGYCHVSFDSLKG